ncbi:MAG TPA: hypothetical protein VFA33_13220 [Bryobacteraceae bacterium]|nr:hypothetical protein [Bryobacteraceae bacterium]
MRRLCTFLLLLAWLGPASVGEPLAMRGYYFTFGRMPTLGLPEWRQILDGIRADGGNTVLLWVGGAFRSRKFPITWQYNRDHKNVQSDFVRELIDYAHTRGIRILLGFTPFSYDGVNQYALEHPELKAVQQNGRLAALSGIHCWGYALNPSRPEAQRFMLDYIREMFFDFYPNADGLMIESSDYAICFCRQCQGHYYEREFEFVRKISDEVWRAKPQATILVYPHYFSGASVPGFHVAGAGFPFDKRWTLFFTPHSAHLDPELIQRASQAIYWDESPARHTPHEIQKGAQTARRYHLSGYVPSFEGFTFQVAHPEGGERYLIGTRLKPFGFAWLADGRNPYEELPVRVNRIAYREFTSDPDLDFTEFERRLGKEIFGASANAARTDDLLFLQESFFLDRSWFSASPLASPEILKGRLEMGSLSLAQLSDYRSRLERIEQIARLYRSAADPGSRELGRIAGWITGNWRDKTSLLTNHLR